MPRRSRSLVTLTASALWVSMLLGCDTPTSASRVPSSPVAARGTPVQPEIATGFQRKEDVVLSKHAVAAAHPLATQAGVEMLQAGGSAIDAAIAVQMMLGLVEPQSSGLGGGAFLMYSTPQANAGVKVQAFDGRETAPAASSETLFLQADGKPMSFHEAAVGGRAVGTPGVLAMLAQVHAQHGKLPWRRLFEPAIRRAEQGFPIGARLHAQLKADPYLRLDPQARHYFYQAQGEPHPVGHLLRNPELASVLRRIAQQGTSAFYQGEVAQALVQKVQQHPSNPGALSLRDLTSYQAKERPALCFDYTAMTRTYRICGMPPPSSGTLAIGQILGMLQHTPASMMPAPNAVEAIPDPRWLHLYTEAARLAFADRAVYVADPDFVPGPGGDWYSLLASNYLRERAKLIRPTAMPLVVPGTPVKGLRNSAAPMPAQPEYGTSHISIVDAQGHALAMTTSIEDAFGARQMVKGFLLNNQLTDFSFTPRDTQGRAIANRVQALKRPRSSMSPLLVLDPSTGQVLMVVGSPGGAMIIHYTAKALYSVLNWGLQPGQALALPNFGTLGSGLLLESQRMPASALATLRERGQEVRSQALTSGVHMLWRSPGAGASATRWVGAADPRREGEVMGD